jgi:cytochrome bd ubiquinol oxidase subunit I
MKESVQDFERIPMSDLFAARSQMAMSLAFHILFAVIGMGMPLLMIIAEGAYLKTKNPIYLELAKRWSKGTILMFAVGAVSGTVLSFELGLLWPKFMEFAGPVIGMPFSLEGFAFFLEAIFLGIYVYGWNRVAPKMHFFSGVMVLICGTASGVFVVCANAWMNTPAGFTLKSGIIANINPWAAMFNPAAFSQTLHMVIGAFVTIGFAVAGVHAYMLLRKGENPFHRRAFSIALLVAALTIPLQWISGDQSAKHVAEYQPIKLAAMEGQWETISGAPLRILGWPNAKTETTPYAIEIPYMLSFLAYGNFDATISGLKDYPIENRPPVWPVHVSFQIMVGCASFMMLTILLGAWLKLRKKKLGETRWFLWLTVICAPLGFIAIEAGWMVTEIGRQPWVIYNLMRTSEAVTPMPGLVVTFTIYSMLYLFLAVIVAFLLKRLVFASANIKFEPAGKP